MSTELITKTGDAVLIAGGYGVVGRQAAQLIRRRHPSLPLIIAGRNPAPADSLARELTHAGVTQLDVLRPNPLNRLRPRAIVAAVNDPHDYLLMDAVQNGIPYLDITRWTERLRSTVSHLSARPLMTAVMLSSGWMAGIGSVMAAAASRRLNRTDSIDLSILYSLRDKAGPNSVEYLDRLATPFEVMLNGERTQVNPFTDPRKITFPVGRRATAYRFDTPDQYTLPVATGAKTVSARIAFDDAVTSGLLVFLIRSGIWKLISGRRFSSLRRSLLYNPGDGARHELVIETTGLDKNDAPTAIRTDIIDPQGQTHLTAAGTLIQLERLLGLDGARPSAPGIVYPDTAPQIDSALEVLHEFNVTVVTN